MGLVRQTPNMDHKIYEWSFIDYRCFFSIDRRKWILKIFTLHLVFLNSWIMRELWIIPQWKYVGMAMLQNSIKTYYVNKPFKDEIKIIFAGKELGDSISVDSCDLGSQVILAELASAVSTRFPLKVTKAMQFCKIKSGSFGFLTWIIDDYFDFSGCIVIYSLFPPLKS